MRSKEELVKEIKALNERVSYLEQENRELKSVEGNKRESKFKQTEAIAHVGSWEWDIATDKVTWSDELFRIFRTDPKKGGVSYADHPKICTKESMSILDKAVNQTLKTGKGYSLDLDIIRGDGEIGHCIARGFAKHDEKGKIIKLYGSFQNITERKQSGRDRHCRCSRGRIEVCKQSGTDDPR